MLLEICANSYTSAINAQKGGAHRIELCERLSVGGVTPNSDLISKVKRHVSIPVFVLVRPRGGNFVYTVEEFELMKKTIAEVKTLECHGVISGTLNDDSTIDIERTRELITLARPLAFTFHRAFDEVPDATTAIEQLIELQVDRVLTSGQQPEASDGIQLLNNLKRHVKDKLIVLPGGGITPENAALFREHGFRELHSSARKKTNTERAQSATTETEIVKSLCEIISQ